jgi:hypothetical protein
MEPTGNPHVDHCERSQVTYRGRKVFVTTPTHPGNQQCYAAVASSCVGNVSTRYFDLHMLSEWPELKLHGGDEENVWG